MTEPLTAREALLEIRRRIAAGNLNNQFGQLAIDIDRIAECGLDRTSPVNFEQSDTIADRLAEAHKLLRKVREAEMVNSGEINEVLALPPDIESMVERRIGPG